MKKIVPVKHYVNVKIKQLKNIQISIFVFTRLAKF